jgi:hypothetical protein
MHQTPLSLKELESEIDLLQEGAWDMHHVDGFLMELW